MTSRDTHTHTHTHTHTLTNTFFVTQTHTLSTLWAPSTTCNIGNVYTCTWIKFSYVHIVMLLRQSMSSQPRQAASYYMYSRKYVNIRKVVKQCRWQTTQHNNTFHFRKNELPQVGFEPTTSRFPGKCSTNYMLENRADCRELKKLPKNSTCSKFLTFEMRTDHNY